MTNLEGGGSASTGGASSSLGRLYNPYEGLHASLDPKILGSIRLPNAPEHLFSEEATRQKRSWGENLSYYTGLGYLGGTFAGGVYGGIEGMRAKAPQASLDTNKLRLNRLINSTMHRGKMFRQHLWDPWSVLRGDGEHGAEHLDHTVRDEISSWWPAW